MIGRVLILTSAVIMFGCAQSDDQGQQYLDGKLDRNLEEVGEVHTTAPQDFTTFAKQAEQVEIKSPSLKSKYSNLYAQLNVWAQESGDPTELAKYGVNIEQLAGADKKGNILFTGYFSPVIEMRHTPDHLFKYPVYAKPKCGAVCPTRAQVYDGALKGKGLELGYASNMIDPFLMEVQGSGFVHYADSDELDYFAYSGKNNHPYVSIGRVLIDRGIIPKEKMSMKAIKDWALANDPDTVKELLEQNPSYVFFERQPGAKVVGAAGIPLLPMAAVAGDRSIFPMGTPILAEVPLLDVNGQWTGVHVLKLLIVLDTGGAVKGGHLDLYHGMGARAGIAAGHYQHFGRVWKLDLTAPPLQIPSN
ncbi:murein transglycosylase A [Vibrio rumoiensis 1S-45]|uniref:peptidoglycan lytic exotransglycosylase n=1 Tax=Vibrio rumoiensis 1S-45 TaxID=1188252 RepID=A0A1E5E3E0_9VIBR|nr:murein transglycosylase A [Vibrio rumoiensis 1S-45]